MSKAHAFRTGGVISIYESICEAFCSYFTEGPFGRETMPAPLSLNSIHPFREWKEHLGM